MGKKQTLWPTQYILIKTLICFNQIVNSFDVQKHVLSVRTLLYVLFSIQEKCCVIDTLIFWQFFHNGMLKDVYLLIPKT